MKNLTLLIILFVFVSCGGPSPKVRYPTDGTYYSTVFTDYSGATTSCRECMVLQVNDNTLTISLNPSPGVTTCSGTATYRSPVGASSAYFRFPTAIGSERNIVIESVSTPPTQTDNPGGGDCFPQPNQETMIVKMISGNEFTVYFNNTAKGYIVRKF